MLRSVYSVSHIINKTIRVMKSKEKYIYCKFTMYIFSYKYKHKIMQDDNLISSGKHYGVLFLLY